MKFYEFGMFDNIDIFSNLLKVSIISSRGRSFSPNPINRVQRCERHRRSTSPSLPVFNLSELSTSPSSHHGIPQINIIPPLVDVEKARVLITLRYLKN